MIKIINKIISKIRYIFGEIKDDPNNNSFESLKELPRYTETTIQLCGKKLLIPDNASFLFLYEELFEKEIYKFNSPKNNPFIIDCGCNIGLSIIYFKTLYRDAEIIGFEPDSRIFNILEENVKTFEITNTTLVNKAVWDSDISVNFFSEGADAGRVVINDDADNIVQVNTARLRRYLEREVDLLKIDIEGSEYTVLKDCSDKLSNVRHIFVEYHSFIGREQNLPELIGLLKKSGFRLYMNTPGFSSLKPFVKINTYSGMDMQLNIYGYRV